MRRQINKLTKGHSTKAERKFVELLKRYKIPFRAKVKVNGMEIDFLIGLYAIEIDGHLQNAKKNRKLVETGITPIHFNNWESPEEWIKQYGRIYILRSSSYNPERARGVQ